MKIPNISAFNATPTSYDLFSNSPMSSGNLPISKAYNNVSDKVEKHSIPKSMVGINSAAAGNKTMRDLESFVLYTNADGDTLETGFAQVKYFVERFGWDKAPPDTLKGIVDFREKTLTIFNQDGDRLDINYRSATGQQAVGDIKPLEETTGCTTCKNRKYVDQSTDSSVSYQTPTSLNSQTATMNIAAHEKEHVNNERAKADREGSEITNQTVTIQYSVCPECNRMYASGGTTRTQSISRSKEEQEPAQDEQVINNQ